MINTNTPAASQTTKDFAECKTIAELQQSFSAMLSNIIEPVLNNEGLWFEEKLRVVKGITVNAEKALKILAEEPVYYQTDKDDHRLYWKDLVAAGLNPYFKQSRWAQGLTHICFTARPSIVAAIFEAHNPFVYSNKK